MRKGGTQVRFPNRHNYLNVDLYKVPRSYYLYCSEETYPHALDYAEAAYTWFTMYQGYFVGPHYEYVRWLKAQAPKPPKHLQMLKKEIKAKRLFCRIIELERAQLLLVIRLLEEGKAKVSAVTNADGVLSSKDWTLDNEMIAQNFVKGFTDRMAYSTVSELNGVVFEKD